MFLFGPPNVKEMKARRDVNGLIRALGYKKDEYVRKAAVYALGEIKDPRAVEPLIAALKDKDVRKAAAEALDHLGWKPAQDESAGWYWMAKHDWDKCVALGALAVEPLSAALKDKEWKVRAAAARALGKIQDPRAVEPLIAALKDTDKDVREAAVYALGEIKDPRAVEPLIAALKDAEWRVRTAADEALVKIGAPAVEPLIAALKDKDSDVRKAAAQVLGEIKDPRAVKPLSAALKDEEWDVCQAAAEALGKIKDPRAVDPLIAALKDTDKDVREAAVYALGEIKDPRAVEPLIAALKDENSDVRQAAAKALEKIKDPRAVEPLIAALKDYYSDVRQAAARALDRLGWKPAHDEIAGWYWSAKNEWDKCIGLGHLAVEPLIAALSHRDLVVRAIAAKALVEFYKEVSVSEDVKARILSVRWKITNLGHKDEIGLPEYNPLGGCVTKDDYQHTDRNIGVDFPL
jgi:HEAT repeat protein